MIVRSVINNVSRKVSQEAYQRVRQYAFMSTESLDFLLNQKFFRQIRAVFWNLSEEEWQLPIRRLVPSRGFNLAKHYDRVILENSEFFVIEHEFRRCFLQ